MLNPMLQNLNQSRVTQTIQMIKAISNPQTMIQQLPQFKQVMDYVNENGGDPQRAFYKMADQMGINPDDIINQLK